MSENPPSIASARARMFFRPLTGGDVRGPSKPIPVVVDRDVALAGRPLSDRHLRARRVRVPPHVGQPLLHDPEDLDLLVGRDPID